MNVAALLTYTIQRTEDNFHSISKLFVYSKRFQNPISHVLNYFVLFSLSETRPSNNEMLFTI